MAGRSSGNSTKLQSLLHPHKRQEKYVKTCRSLLLCGTLCFSCSEGVLCRIERVPSKRSSVPVVFTLVGARDLDTDVVSLFLRELGELGTQSGQVEPCNLLVKILGKQVHIVLVGLRLLPVLQEIQLGQSLVCE